MSGLSSVTQNLVIKCPDTTCFVQEDIDVGEEGVIIDAKLIVVMPGVTVRAKSITATCKETFVTLGCLNIVTLDLTAKDVYLAGTMTCAKGAVTIITDELPSFGEELAQKALARILHQFVKYEQLPPATCHQSADRFG